MVYYLVDPEKRHPHARENGHGAFPIPGLPSEAADICGTDPFLFHAVLIQLR